MRKVIFLTVLLLVGILVIGANATSAEEGKIVTESTDINTRIGLDLPTIGWPYYNDEGQLKGWRGLNIGVGYSQINYFDPLKLNEFNPFWDFGSLFIIVPYVGIGAEYPMEVGDENYVSFSGGVGLPYGLRIGASYAW